MWRMLTVARKAPCQDKLGVRNVSDLPIDACRGAVGGGGGPDQRSGRPGLRAAQAMGRSGAVPDAPGCAPSRVQGLAGRTARWTVVRRHCRTVDHLMALSDEAAGSWTIGWPLPVAQRLGGAVVLRTRNSVGSTTNSSDVGLSPDPCGPLIRAATRSMAASASRRGSCTIVVGRSTVRQPSPCRRSPPPRCRRAPARPGG